MKNRLLNIALITLGLAMLSGEGLGAPRGRQPIPDFTRGGKTDGSHDWTLGATGASGWIYAWKHTGDARQILITTVAVGSPAAGILEPGDVILGIDNKPFSSDARISFARAVTAAEVTGQLKVLRWRQGATENVVIKLPVMGAYSATAPYDCEKSAKILQAGCQAIASRGLANVSISNSINALALLASGQRDYRPLLDDYARKVSGMRLDSMATWNYSYALMFLSEYAMATGDQSVMPAVKRLALESALGQSAVGTWGHKFALPSGGLSGYGAMNSPGIPLAVAMVLAREAGVNDPTLDRAIQRASSFLRWYLYKGAPPYGDHEPWPGHEDNGKSSNAAVLFDLLGDQEAATFFAKMGLAAYDERERGHTGNFFNILWAMPGVSRCGPQATGAYWREQGWYYDLARGWDGSFRYQGSPVGEEEHGKHTSWDNTGTYLLAYAMPLKKIRLTGKGRSAVSPLTEKEAAAVIDAGRGFFGDKKDAVGLYDRRTEEDLIAGLASWSPAVRKRSAAELARRNGDFLPIILQMLASKERDAQYGAVEALGALGPKADRAARDLKKLLAHHDPWMRSLAASSLNSLSAEKRIEALPELLELLSTTGPDDPRGMVQRAATKTLFGRGGIITGSLDGVDRKALYPAIKTVLQNQDGRTRSGLAPIFPKLNERDIAILLPDIVKATREIAPSGEMFADTIRLAGLDILARHGIREGLPLCIEVIEPDRWGLGRRLPGCFQSLARYGNHAQQVLPQLKEIRASLAAAARGKPSDHLVAIDAAITAIETSTKTPTLVTMAEFTAKHAR